MGIRNCLSRRCAGVCTLVGWLLTAGCATGPQPVPAWMMHVPYQPVGAEADLASGKSRLIEELGTYYLRTPYMPPEQITGYALEAFHAGHTLDAAVLLGIASYTFNRQAAMAYTRGNAKRAYDMRNASTDGKQAYDLYLRDEYLAFADLDFFPEMDLLISFWEKERGRRPWHRCPTTHRHCC